MEGLQIQRWSFKDDVRFSGGRTHYAMVERDNGKYVLFSDAEKLHDTLQEALGKNMKLAVERDELALLLDTLNGTIQPMARMLEKVRGKDEAAVKDTEVAIGPPTHECPGCGNFFESESSEAKKCGECLLEEAEKVHDAGECGGNCSICKDEEGAKR